MKKLLTLVLFLFACGAPPGKVQPFIFIELIDAEGFVAPVADTLEVTNRAIVAGNPIEKIFEVPGPGHALPTSFAIQFSEPVRGTIVDISIVGLANGEPVFLSTASAIADTSSIEMIARFCGDVTIDDDRDEQCDDGPSNSDSEPDACRSSCQLASCGDAVVDSSEQCDDGSNNSDVLADACRSTCSFASCGDGATDSGEQCDDGSQNSDLLADACRTDCTLPRCGDGVTDGSEECDDSNTTENDGCDNDCATTKVTQLALGFAHTCALFRTGDVKCWGQNNVGQLGYGNTINVGDNELPSLVGVVDLGGPAKQITAGDVHTCALLETNQVKCWGSNGSGRLGYNNIGNVGDDELPSAVGVVSLGANASQVSAGSTHTCALLVSGGVRCWGSGSAGRLGYGNINNIGDNEPPSSVGPVSLGGIAISVSAGSTHTCALLVGGIVKCWGLGSQGQLGYGNINNIGDDELPSSIGPVIVANAESSIAINAGLGHTCALLSSLAVRCWGNAFSGELGYGNTNDIGDDEAPATAGNVNVGGSVSSLSSDGLSCALLSSGGLVCWGSNSDGQLGYGNTVNIGDNETPASAGLVDVGGVVSSITVGSRHACAIVETGQIKCWGDGLSGRLGYGSEANLGDNETLITVGVVPLF